MPASVIQRFFGKKESLTNYLAGLNQETTFAMLDDLCATYKYEEANREELTEFCYILFESAKGSLMCQDMIKCKSKLNFNLKFCIVLSKWQQLGYIHLFSYILKQFENAETNHESFVLLANIVK